MLKNLVIKVAGTGEVHEFAVEEGTTVGELLESNPDWKEYELSKGAGEPALRKDFPLSKLPANTTLYAGTEADAGIS